MKITTVKYGRTYPLGNYASERIDVEATIDETDNIGQVFDMLKGICDGQHKSNHPQLHEETPIQPQYYNGSINCFDKEGNKVHPTPIDNPPFTPKTQPHSTIEAINSCTTLKVLQEFDLIVKNMSNKYPEIKEAYDNKLKELTENL